MKGEKKRGNDREPGWRKEREEEEEEDGINNC
jgi:hypothetical protein